MTKEFLRRNWSKHSKFGKGRKKKKAWRKPKGRDNKMREKRKGYPVVVSIGYQKQKSKEKQVIIINNLKDLETIKENQKVIIGKVGRKKKIEIVKKINQMKILVLNLDVKKFLEKIDKKEEKNESK